MVSDPTDPDAALQRLESMSTAGPQSSSAAPLPPAPAVSVPRPAPHSPGRGQRPARSRPRPAAGPHGSRLAARIAAPVVFLIAVIALIGIATSSGVIGGSDPSPTPSPKATKNKGGSSNPAGTKKYTVKSGDTLSAIASRFDTSVSEIEELNPDLTASTLVAGDKILVPTE